MRAHLHFGCPPQRANNWPAQPDTSGVATQDVSFGVFGLGNKQYEHFCAVGKRMHRALAALGATPLVNRGEGDDDDDIEADFEAWRTDLYQALDKATVMAKADVRSQQPFGLTHLCCVAPRGNFGRVERCFCCVACCVGPRFLKLAGARLHKPFLVLCVKRLQAVVLKVLVQLFLLCCRAEFALSAVWEYMVAMFV